MKTIELSLPDELHERIRRIAKKKAKPAKEIMRHAISAGLAVQEARERHRAILAYARRVAGSRDDLDTDLESASIDALMASLDAQE